MLLGTYRKQPYEELDLDIEIADWLAERPTDSLATATSTVSPAGLTITVPEITGTVIKQWYTGGVDNTVYTVTVKLVTTQVRKKEYEFRVWVKEV